MSNEKDTKDVVIDELAEKLAEGLTEEAPVEEAPAEEAPAEEAPITEEAPAEEVPAEVAPTEEASAEEAPAEEAPVEETPAEEVPAEETPIEKKKSKKALIITLSVVAAVMACIAIAYFAVASHYKERFFMKTAVNGVDCSGKTIDEVEAMLQKRVEEYVLTIEGKNGVSEQIQGTDIEVKYIGYNQIKEAFAEQNSYLWPKSLFQSKDIDAEIVFEYNQEKLNAMIAALECMKPENQTAPVSATVVYEDGEFVVQKESQGTQLDAAKVNEVINGTVLAMKTTVNLETSACYIQPTFTEQSPEVLTAKEQMNKYLTAKITYSLDGIELVVDKNTIAPWISVDANMQPVISTDLVTKFTYTLAAKYNTPNQAAVIETPTGKQASIPNAILGRQVGNSAECNQLISEIKEGKTVSRAPIFSQNATPAGQLMWGNKYVEVDIGAQHMWFVQVEADGTKTVLFETDVVTGTPNAQRATPTGTFTVLKKMQNKVLRGNTMPNGKPEYLTPVKYWVRITWSGVGFHDATWQPAFGGELYKQGYGSHGCINMPLEAAKTFYEMAYVGCPVVVHY